ncbi:MAG: MG2 domain-containing protein, partial [Methylococcaceae bacterium]|nr:MG2 domain-containing protein [Methylococcaceae bacterium]
MNQRRALGDDYFYLLSPEDAETGSRLQGDALKQAESGLLVVQCRRSLPPETEVRLIWGKGIRSASGVAGKEDRVLNFKTRPAFTARLRCQRVNPQAACLPMLPLEVFFTAEVPAEQLMAVRLVDEMGKEYPIQRIDPGKTPVSHTLSFNGPFPEKARLRIELPADLHDDAGRPLQNAARFPLQVPVDEYPPLAKFSGDFGIIERAAGGILPVTLRNLEPQVEGRQLVVEAVDGVPGQVQRLTENDSEIIRWLERVKQAVRLRGEWVTSKGGKEDAAVWKEQTGSESVFARTDPSSPMTVPKPLGAKEFEVIGIPLVRPGFYVVELSSPKLGASLLGDKQTRYVATSALVTNLGVHFKWGREGSLVWVTTLDKAAPVSGARIQISDYCSGKVLWQGQTTPEGISRVPSGAIPKPHGGDDCSEGSPVPLFVSARVDDDLGFTASFWNKGIQPADFNLNVGDYLGPEIVHTVFDRPLFRAGETVSMKHFLRRHTLEGFGLPKAFQPAFVEITHTGSDQQFRLPAAADTQGIVESVWAIPRDARLGAYQVALTDAKQAQRFESGRFHVEQFRLPTMKAVIQPPKDEQINPGEMPLDLYLAHLNGGGASQAPVKLRTLLEPKDVSFSGYENYVFGGETIREGLSEESDFSEAEESTSRKPAEVLPLVLDAKGAARTTLKNLPKSRKPQDLIVEMEYQDANGEMEAVTRRVPLWPAGINLGLKTEGWVASRDQARFHVAALDLRGKPVAHQPIEVDLFERKTYSWRKRLIGGFYAYDNRTEVTRIKDGCKGRTDAMGLLHCVVKPGVAGEILLQASSRDEQGNEAVSMTSLWLAGEDDTWFDGSGTDRIDLIPEQREYQPGETARFQVRMPFRSATALVTVEREGVAESFVTTLSGKAPVINVPIKGEH